MNTIITKWRNRKNHTKGLKRLIRGLDKRNKAQRDYIMAADTPPWWVIIYGPSAA